MKNNVNLSTNLSKETKELLDKFCKHRGIKINHFIEKAIIATLEDEMDLELINEREFEELRSLRGKVKFSIDVDKLREDR